MNEQTMVARVGKLRDDHEQAKERLRKLSVAGRLLTFGIVVVLATSLVLLYGKVTEMYAAEKFEEPFKREAQRLIPQFEPEFRTLWEQTAPVYSDMAMEKFQAALPAFQEVGQRELDALLTELRASAEQQVDQSLKRVAAGLQQQMEGQFPELDSDERAELRLQQWAEIFEEDLTQVLVHFETRYLEDLGTLEATLEKFRPSEYEQMSEDELMRQFAHLWLAKLDRWVLSGDAGASLAIREVKDGN